MHCNFTTNLFRTQTHTHTSVQLFTRSRRRAVIGMCHLALFCFPSLSSHSSPVSCVPACCHDHRCQEEWWLHKKGKPEPQILLPRYLIHRHGGTPRFWCNAGRGRAEHGNVCKSGQRSAVRYICNTQRAIYLLKCCVGH